MNTCIILFYDLFDITSKSDTAKFKDFIFANTIRKLCQMTFQQFICNSVLFHLGFKVFP